jgi:hypothetical protein
VFLLEFAEAEFDGLEVRMRPSTVGELLEMSEFDRSNKTELKAMFERFAEALLSWNLEDDNGVPVPATVDGIKSQDVDLILAIIAAWQSARTGDVSAPKEPPSSVGLPSLVESLPMEPLSPNLAS